MVDEILEVNGSGDILHLPARRSKFSWVHYTLYNRGVRWTAKTLYDFVCRPAYFEVLYSSKSTIIRRFLVAPTLDSVGTTEQFSRSLALLLCKSGIFTLYNISVRNPFWPSLPICSFVAFFFECSTSKSSRPPFLDLPPILFSLLHYRSGVLSIFLAVLVAPISRSVWCRWHTVITLLGVIAFVHGRRCWVADLSSVTTPIFF